MKEVVEVDDSWTPEVLTIGRCSVDLYPLEVGVKLEDVATFGKFLGGSATNVAVAAARHGHGASVLTGVGDDPFGRFVIKELGRLGVDASHVVTNAAFNTPVTFCEIFPPDDFPLYFYRQPTTPDLELTAADLPSRIREYKILWLTSSGLSVEPSRTAHHAAVSARTGGLSVLDLDHRPRFWSDEATATHEVGEMLARVDVAIGNIEECRVAVGETDPERAADALLERGVDIAVVKQGMTGTLAKSRDERSFVPATRVKVLNGLGAGDAFGGALCHGLLDGWDLHRTIAFASAAGAIVASRLECSTAMPTTTEVEALLGSTGEPRPGHHLR
ncbi:5-dehydro-2-deoxygluconokinase [Tessaracoccus antarcticus]|uniref:5-dehydro-2-deoxygluconokinase n=1 Tax=Tessaracoccus antarcticus TaxID=2479848 RepID=A0A3M0G9Q4_9ACTN|nr:5-dehydro-2-deoxygluconokinase [Tessaracoccus antarcticus]RMB61614.1 5-dehydro-2-deoxygluconokinase [Tessaracoccus antarcticus]